MESRLRFPGHPLHPQQVALATLAAAVALDLIGLPSGAASPFAAACRSLDQQPAVEPR